jgi:hypothetical protein
VLIKNAKIMFTNTMSIFCSIPLISLLFACSEIPKVSYETIKLQRPITIDCEGGAYNKGKVTELQILADNVTIKRCKINGSIRTIGLGSNGEAPGVKTSSVKAGHTERAQAVAPKGTVLYAVTISPASKQRTNPSVIIFGEYDVAIIMRIYLFGRYSFGGFHLMLMLYHK